jgi:hypothetical protein
MFRLGIIISVVFLLCGLVSAEEKKVDSTWTKPTNIVPLKPAADTTKVDTIYYTPGAVRREAERVTNPINFEEHLTQQPTIALFKSMLVPGWGQLGNRKYLKAAIVIGLEGWLISEAYNNGRDASDAWDRFAAESDPYIRDALHADYQDKRAQRNKYTWFAGIVVFASMFDAYVDAHLSGAPEQVKVSKVDFDITPEFDGGVSASLSLRF